MSRHSGRLTRSPSIRGIWHMPRQEIGPLSDILRRSGVQMTEVDEKVDEHGAG
ncbi:hypothetical protein [Phaeobacter piscinae]|uniref:hypothetical protein n=1 Tax=Phaeobacter piscinae TaxID=1580596 RepID=UPI00131438E9|nr:hypothetical protein [Phaeobacter piscinae]